jgi:hypothetical protein
MSEILEGEIQLGRGAIFIFYLTTPSSLPPPLVITHFTNIIPTGNNYIKINSTARARFTFNSKTKKPLTLQFGICRIKLCVIKNKIYKL